VCRMGWFKFRKKEEPAPAPGPAMFSIAVDAKFISKLRPYVAPPKLLDPNIAEGAPEVLPGIVMAVAIDMGNQVNFMPVSSMIELLPKDQPNRNVKGPELTRLVAIENLRKLPLPPVHITQTSPGRPDSEVILLEQQDSFVASRITFLNELVDRVAGRTPRPYGVLVSIPRRRTVLLHVPSGLGVLTAMRSMAISTRSLFDSSTQSRLSPNVYYVGADGSAETIAFPDKADGVVIQTIGRLKDVLYGPDGLLPKGLEHEGHNPAAT
jgi:hypothetical protein